MDKPKLLYCCYFSGTTSCRRSSSSVRRWTRSAARTRPLRRHKVARNSRSSGKRSWKKVKNRRRRTGDWLGQTWVDVGFLDFIYIYTLHRCACHCVCVVEKVHSFWLQQLHENIWEQMGKEDRHSSWGDLSPVRSMGPGRDGPSSPHFGVKSSFQ